MSRLEHPSFETMTMAERAEHSLWTIESELENFELRFIAFAYMETAALARIEASIARIKLRGTK